MGYPERPARFFVGLNKTFVHFLSLVEKKAGIVPYGASQSPEIIKAGLTGLLLLINAYFS